MSRRRDDDMTFQMFYEWYYAPIFRARFPGHATVELFEMSPMEKWSLELSKHLSSRHSPVEVGVTADPGDAPTKPSPEYMALSKAAIQGDALIWTLMGLTSAVNSCLDKNWEVDSVLALVFSISIQGDPSISNFSQIRELLPMFSGSYLNLSISPAAPTAIMASTFQNCQYNPNSALGKRLLEDVRLWLEVAADAGLQRELKPYKEHTSASNEEVIAGTLLGLLLQPWPWVARVLPLMGSKLDRLVFLKRGYLWVGSEGKPAIHFLRQLKATGINLDFDDEATRMPFKVSQRKPLQSNFHLHGDPLILYGDDIPLRELVRIKFQNCTRDHHRKIESPSQEQLRRELRDRIFFQKPNYPS